MDRSLPLCTSHVCLAAKQQELGSKQEEGQQGLKTEALQGERDVTSLPGYRISWVFYNDVVAQHCLV